MSEISGANFSWMRTKAKTRPRRVETIATPIAEKDGSRQGSRPIQPKRPEVSPTTLVETSSEETMTRKAISVGTETKSDSSVPTTLTLSARSGSRNMW